ncbi:hypothetical protein [Rhizobium lusitanum]|uniref:Uncharacterized protein n=1 Tax=Rhizobium lusitanum TaxID=293958 RepID=A0A1C3XHY6_9HYPH|nr:hypothetical protein [Rhizobium lusitanum]SCB51873.1 hypothetical protein GA0061101_14338 [Rhizobium lusitanum]
MLYLLSTAGDAAVVCPHLSYLKRASIIASALLATSALSGCNFFDPPLVTACEENLKGVLVKPSSYRRGDFNITSIPVTRSELDNYFEGTPLKTLRKEALERFDDGTERPVRYMLNLQFTADNENAETVTTKLACEYFSFDGKQSSVVPFVTGLKPLDISEFSRLTSKSLKGIAEENLRKAAEGLQ